MDHDLLTFTKSNLAGVFINLEGVFPCLQSLSNYLPICQVFSKEEDGFRGGKAFIGASDVGNNIRVFSSISYILTYGVAIQECPEFTISCLSAYHSFIVACYLPRAACSWSMKETDLHTNSLNPGQKFVGSHSYSVC